MLARYACHPDRSRGRRHAEPESPGRTCFQRDRDRIIHSGAFRKLEHKTQVFVHAVGDYYRTRLTHSLEVAQIARSLSRRLKLNEDLAEAVALAHDLGHTPFGHAGEDALDAEMALYGGFDHNDQTVRILTVLERRYAAFDGLNPSWETLEGVVKHNGPLRTAAGAVPTPTVAALDAGWDLALDRHASAEAQVAALADDIAYINHDIDDGLRAGMIGIDDLRVLPLVGTIVAAVEAQHPGLERRRLIHETVRRLVDRMANDLLDRTGAALAALAPETPDDIRAAGAPVAAFSDEMQAVIAVLRPFLFERVYRDFRVNRETAKARRVIRGLFRLFMAEPSCLPDEWRADAARGGTDGLPSRLEAVRARTVADYIAGMTDRYAVLEHRRLFDIGPET